ATPRRFEELLRRDQLVDSVVDTVGLNQPIDVDQHPDIAVNLHGCGPESHTALVRLLPHRTIAYACSRPPISGPRWHPGEHERHRWSRLVAACCPAGYAPDRVELTPPVPIDKWRGAVVVHPGASTVKRRWPLERWAE